MMIWIDADACPRAVKELVFRTSARLDLPLCLVANRPLTAPPSPLITVVQVRAGSDVADSYIVQHVAAGDLVITADIPQIAAALVRYGHAVMPFVLVGLGLYILIEQDTLSLLSCGMAATWGSKTMSFSPCCFSSWARPAWSGW